jgi:hypothetical protein
VYENTSYNGFLTWYAWLCDYFNNKKRKRGNVCFTKEKEDSVLVLNKRKEIIVSLIIK